MSLLCSPVLPHPVHSPTLFSCCRFLSSAGVFAPVFLLLLFLLPSFSPLLFSSNSLGSVWQVDLAAVCLLTPESAMGSALRCLSSGLQLRTPTLYLLRFLWRCCLLARLWSNCFCSKFRTYQLWLLQSLNAFSFWLPLLVVKSSLGLNHLDSSFCYLEPSTLQKNDIIELLFLWILLPKFQLDLLHISLLFCPIL